MISSIANSLGFGSGVDVAKLVSDLAAASRTPKVQAFDARARTSQAKISAVAQARSDLESFSTSLATVVSGGTLQTQPRVSDDAALGAVAAPGVRLGNFSAEMEVTQLAKSQTSYSATIASATDPIGQGSLVLAVGATSFTVTIDSTNDSLGGLATAINAANSGVKASVITDASGARLVLKGETGATKAFTLTAQTGNDPLLDRFASAALVTPQVAQDAAFALDGVPYTRGTNSFSDVISGVTLTLRKAAPGTAIAIGGTRPTDALRSTIGDFVSVYNQMKTDISAALTATGGDQSLRALDQQLSRFISQTLTSDPAIKSLADIGVTTNRDGSLSLNASKFDAAVAANPDAVEAIFSPTRDATHTDITDPGLSSSFKALVTAATTQDGGLVSLKARLDKEAVSLAKDRARMEDRETAYADRLNRQYQSMDARVGALKATQSYLDQQIKIWTRSS